MVCTSPQKSNTDSVPNKVVIPKNTNFAKKYVTEEDITYSLNWTEHVKQRCAERNITRSEVVQDLYDAMLNMNMAGNDTYCWVINRAMNRSALFMKHNNKLLDVITVVNSNEPKYSLKERKVYAFNNFKGSIPKIKEIEGIVRKYYALGCSLKQIKEHLDSFVSDNLMNALLANGKVFLDVPSQMSLTMEMLRLGANKNFILKHLNCSEDSFEKWFAMYVKSENFHKEQIIKSIDPGLNNIETPPMVKTTAEEINTQKAPTEITTSIKQEPVVEPVVEVPAENSIEKKEEPIMVEQESVVEVTNEPDNNKYLTIQECLENLPDQDRYVDGMKYSIIFDKILLNVVLGRICTPAEMLERIKNL